MLTWPHDSGDWAPLLSRIEPVFYAIALEIARRETLLINCATAAQRDRVRTRLVQSGAPEHQLRLAVVASNDTWARDHGPLTVLERDGPRLLDFRFNGWGNKYPSQDDDAITRRLGELGYFGSTPLDSIELVLEAGSVDSDGNGTILTTRSCLLHPQRNPDCSMIELEKRLHALLGARRLLWLAHGALAGDDTDGHIDMLARFCSTDTIVYQACTEPGYPFFDDLTAMHAELQDFRTASGQPYRLLALPWPGAKRGPEGARLPASYANFLVINGAVLVPSYEDPADDEAARVVQSCFADREVVQIPCLPLIQQYGSLHCLTMQFPKGVEFGSPTAG
jgi:agmatine deiminase